MLNLRYRFPILGFDIIFSPDDPYQYYPHPRPPPHYLDLHEALPN